MPDPYQPKHEWRRTQIDDRDPPTDFDWTGWCNGDYLGRIRKELHGPTKGRWQWAGSYSRSWKGAPPTPNTGWVANARIAVQMCEEYWERASKAMRPS